MTDEELVAKFARNAEGVLSRRTIDQAAMQLLSLEKVEDINSLMRLLTK